MASKAGIKRQRRRSQRSVNVQQEAAKETEERAEWSPVVIVHMRGWQTERARHVEKVTPVTRCYTFRKIQRAAICVSLCSIII